MIEGHGISIKLPDGWEGRIVRRAGAGPVLHAASFPLHPGDGDFGAAATGRMRPGDAFLALVEYLPSHELHPGRGLFAPKGIPKAPPAADFSPAALQVTRAGWLGWQRFFTENGRPGCLYLVIRPGPGMPERLSQLTRLVASVRVGSAR